MNERNLLLVISGPSGAGKGTICKALVEKHQNNLQCSISATSREVRPGEFVDKTYYYIGKNKFLENIENDQFLEFAEVYGNYYGTLIEEVQRLFKMNADVILEIEMQGALQIREKSEDAVLIFIMPPSFKELRDRLHKRNRDRKEDIQNRLDKVSSELKYIKDYDYIVVNDRLEDAVAKIEAIIIAEKCKMNEKTFDIGTFIKDI
ncbi:MAG: guanylate kinase [Fusobacteria bacterium]|nr:MAG: guanylate kinase [Fusobacteriota bacterium]KAF0229770.1 MAG: guanylate [Fusobacteriota bacterium]